MLTPFLNILDLYAITCTEKFTLSGEVVETTWLKVYPPPAKVSWYHTHTKKRTTSFSTWKYQWWPSEIMARVIYYVNSLWVWVTACQPWWRQWVVDSCGSSRDQWAGFHSVSCLIDQIVGCIKASDADVRGEGTQLDFQVQGERGNL